MNVADTDWKPRARALVEELTVAGKLSSAGWRDAVLAVPRHVFVPEVVTSGPGGWQPMDTETSVGRSRWLDRVYSNTALSIAPGTANGLTLPRSSSSMPGLMTRMLESLAATPGMDVLEIGTGTGYNAALLCHRLGDQHVTSIDVEADLVGLARERLASLGHRPTLVTGDGSEGVPDRAPFDRLIATCAVPSVPWAWIEQTRPGGVVLTDIKTTAGTGSLVRLTRTPDGAEGRFDATYAAFMSLRHRPAGQQKARARPTLDDDGEAGVTHLDPRTPWNALITWFLAGFAIGPVSSLGYTGDPGTGRLTAVRVVAVDGSWASVQLDDREDGGHVVTQGGPRRVWHLVEDADRSWQEFGRPGWERFGLTVGRNGQHVWLDEADGPRWKLSPA